MKLPIKGYSKHYDRWFTPDKFQEEAQFVFRLGEVQLFIYDHYDIVEIVTDFTWTSVPEREKEEALLF